MTQHIAKSWIAVAMLALASYSGVPSGASSQISAREKMTVNPVFHFEIPVTDMDRAIGFYTAVFALPLSRQTIDGYEMAFFPRADGGPGASGALAKGDVYVPSKTGVILYFDVPDIDDVLDRAAAQKGKILYPKKYIGEAGYVAEIEDSEGNRIGLTAANE